MKPEYHPGDHVRFLVRFIFGNHVGRETGRILYRRDDNSYVVAMCSGDDFDQDGIPAITFRWEDLEAI